MTKMKFTSPNHKCRQRNPDTSLEETYQLVLRRTPTAADQPQVQPSDVPLYHRLFVNVVFLHPFVAHNHRSSLHFCEPLKKVIKKESDNLFTSYSNEHIKN